MIRSLSEIKGLGPKRLMFLRNAGICSIDDLLRKVPRRYLDRTKVTSIANLTTEEEATVVGQVEFVREISGHHPRFTCTISDQTGRMELVFFHGIPLWRRRLKEGQKLAASGKVGEFSGKQMVHPDLNFLKNGEEYIGRILPLYSITEEMKSGKMEQNFMRKLLETVLAGKDCHLQNAFPHELCEDYKLIPEIQNLKRLHLPGSMEDVKKGFQQLVIQELLPVCVRVQNSREQSLQKGKSRILLTFNLEEAENLLPFSLTNAQKKACDEIQKGMRQNHQFAGILQGDVGSGKTVVAQISMWLAMQANWQSALLVPTEILAQQHFEKLEPFFKALGFSCKLLTGSMPVEEKKRVLGELKDGSLHCVIGTHILFSKTTEFNNLGFVVIDEQHRFGVEQRLEILKKGHDPDYLSMSATPIPRSLTLTLYGDLQSVLLKEKPEGRKLVQTRLVPRMKRNDMMNFLEQKILEGEKVFWVVPRIAEENGEIQSAESLYKEVSKFSKKWKVGFVHGKQLATERQATIESFIQGNVQLLIATTVIEVGVDVPGAGIIVIDAPERFGLAQLHQLRGRVGRDGREAWCFLLLDESGTATDRLQRFKETEDGFEIAELDLEVRGAGNLEGLEQSGLGSFRYFDFVRDRILIEKILNDIEDIAKNDSDRILKMRKVWVQA